jgi:hypothetical protein
MRSFFIPKDTNTLKNFPKTGHVGDEERLNFFGRVPLSRIEEALYCSALSRRGLKRKTSLHKFDPFRHIYKPSMPLVLKRGKILRWRKACSIVFNFEHVFLFPRIPPYLYLGSLSMLYCVGNRFLENPKKSEYQILGELDFFGEDLKRNSNSRLHGKSLSQLCKGLGKPKVNPGRGESIAHASQLQHHKTSALLRHGKPLIALLRNALSLGKAYLLHKGSYSLKRTIMDFPGQIYPLCFLNAKHIRDRTLHEAALFHGGFRKIQKD